MKATQEVIRLHAAGLSQRQIAQTCRLSTGAVGKYLQKAEQASISWPSPPEMNPAKLEALLFPSLDNWGLAPMKAEDVRDLLKIIDDRVNQSATLITSQLPVNHWHGCLGEATVADAVLD